MLNIISLSGRMASGKTTLAKVCEEMGFKRMSFALPLKTLVCYVTGIWTIDELNAKKNEPLGVNMTEDIIKKLSEGTGIPVDFVIEHTKKLTAASTGRDWLQIVGTDLIRAYDNDWHVKKTMEMLEKDGNYVFDDTRFKNELAALKKIGAECWFIIRTKTDNVSNHASEVQLTYDMFDGNVIVNDSSLDEFTTNWDYYLRTQQTSKYLHDRMYNELLEGKRSFSEDNLKKYYVYKSLKDIDTSRLNGENICPNSKGDSIIVDGYILQNPFEIEIAKAKL